MIDHSNGYEGVADEFLARRGRASSSAIGVRQVQDWARRLPPGATVLDLGCGSGLPLTKVLVDEGLSVFAVDAAPSLVQALRSNLPGVAVICEAVEHSPLFHRQFDAVLAWGLLFLLPSQSQRSLVRKIAEALLPGGRFLFTSPAKSGVWSDVLTGQESRSLGRSQYLELLSSVDMLLIAEYEDEGENHYFEALRRVKSLHPRADCSEEHRRA